MNKRKAGPAQATKHKMKLQDDSGRFSNFLTSERSSKRRSKFVDRETPGTSESLNMAKTLQEQVDMIQ